MSTTTYTVTVQLSDETLLALQANDYALYGFGAVDSASPSHAVVWFRTTLFGENVTLSWTDTYAVYTAEEQNVGGGRIIASSTYPLQPGLGQTFTVTSPAGIGTLSGGGTPGTVVVVNQTKQQMICGLALPAPAGSGGTPAPICAIPLFGENDVVMTPGTAVFLMFAAGTITTGSVMSQSTGPGILIPLSPSAPSQTVAYDINAGWSGGASVYPPMTPLPIGTSDGSGPGGSGSDVNGGWAWTGDASGAAHPPNQDLMPLRIKPAQ